MKLKLFATIILGAILTFGVHAQGTTVSGVTFPKTIKIGSETIEYNGAGLRTKYFFKLYVAALFVPEKTSDAKKIINLNETSAVRIHITSNKVTRERFVETVRDGFKTSTDGKASEAEIASLMKLFDNVTFNEGDEVTLMYRPTSGIEVYMNKDHLGGVKGLEFKKALFSIWLGEKPADAVVKKGMLGL